MNPTPLHPHDDGAADRLLLQAGARLLAAFVTTLAPVGGACAALAAAALLLAPALPALSAIAALPLAAVLALLPLERVLALRLRLDAGLLADLTLLRRDAPLATTLATLDGVLQRLRLRTPAARQRPLDERLRGATRLMFWHGLTVLLQAGLLVLAAWPLLLPSLPGGPR